MGNLETRISILRNSYDLEGPEEERNAEQMAIVAMIESNLDEETKLIQLKVAFVDAQIWAFGLMFSEITVNCEEGRATISADFLAEMMELYEIIKSTFEKLGEPKDSELGQWFARTLLVQYTQSALVIDSAYFLHCRELKRAHIYKRWQTSIQKFY